MQVIYNISLVCLFVHPCAGRAHAHVTPENSDTLATACNLLYSNHDEALDIEVPCLNYRSDLVLLTAHTVRTSGFPALALIAASSSGWGRQLDLSLVRIAQPARENVCRTREIDVQ